MARKKKNPEEPEEPERPLSYREIFDAAWGEEEKLKAIQRVRKAKGNASWVDHAILLGVGALRKKAYITADDIWRACLEHDVKPPNEPRAMGAVTRALSSRRDPLMEKKGDEHQDTERVASHRRPLQVWRSLIWDGKRKAL